ncbi:hypothetical protein SUNI508_08053 [Seiridium unicorne]|uniref:Uncharacterized protein n=1 Tax=Seiridium unicorne TaxID=138068 RepID=A0ABR2UV57_9PEZI
MFHSLLWLLAFVSLASCKPLGISVPNELTKRNPCDGINASPILYHEYGENDCPATNKFGKDGVCSGHFDVQKDCSVFCQVRTTFSYGRERPSPKSYCHGPMTCGITETSSTSWAAQAQIPSKWTEAFGFGVTVKRIEIPFDGTYTNVPGGSISETPIGILANIPWCTSPVTTTGNVCDGAPWKNSDGSVDGETIFVRKDCGDRRPLPADEQDPVYQKPGVALDRGSIAAMIDSWEEDSCDVAYQFWDDFLEVRGKDTSDNDLGDGGVNLKNAIGGCGAVTSWTFDYTPDDVKYQGGLGYRRLAVVLALGEDSQRHS